MASQLSRIMRPDDANVAGNVHGGTILKMIEEAGAIISTRHCNSWSGERCVAALARVERTDFLSPMCIGEVAHVSAEITYTSKHSVEVQVHVMSENILTGTKKLTNKATLWYVPLSLKNVDKVLEVPPVVYSRQEQEEEGRKRYEAQKLARMETKWRNGDIVQPVLNPEPNTVSYSQSSLIHLVGPSDCTLHGFVHGGVTMKLMDEVAGIVAARHCKTNIVTASVDAIDFHDKIRKACFWQTLAHFLFCKRVRKPKPSVGPGWPPAQCAPEPAEPEVLLRALSPGLWAISGPLQEPAFHGDTQWGMAVCSHFSSSENWCPLLNSPTTPGQEGGLTPGACPGRLVAPSADDRGHFPPVNWSCLVLWVDLDM
ncbi:cytosolic acyl coenzyme A thioester hydrolase isoform X3 [Lutra lutra]|uniref:cytosolic acyl coenzyme A thioester hydrolase isoform X3 n=1 Tax=Lutra lutra TaxID=9657 RepID=UPI001FD4E6C0|nr:cytosolic acyl coenzyme A thioester hydrolase isoform X3 [Lutra lutra]